MKPLIIILKTLVIGYLWSIIFIDGLRVVLLINWHFDIFLKEHWILLGEKWNSGEAISNSEITFFLVVLSSIPLLFTGWIGLCLIKWRRLFKYIIYGPLYLYRKLTLKTKPTVIVKKKAINDEPVVQKKATVIKKSTPKTQPLPSATLMQSNIYTKPASASTYPSSASLTKPTSNSTQKKKQDVPLNHALFNFDEDDFDFDFDFDKKDKPKPTEIDNTLGFDAQKQEVSAEKVNNKPKPIENNPKPIDKQPQQPKKDNKSKKEQSHENQSTRESQTPVIDVLNQKGYDVIPSSIIKGIKIDCIGVSKNSLIVCLADKEVGDWLADEEKFNDEEPLWFSESSHRISPVRQVEEVCDILKTKLVVSDLSFDVIPYVVVQSGNIINAEDMFDIWRNMQINVTRINRGSPKEIKLFSKAVDNCEDKTDNSTLEKIRKLLRSLA